MKFVIVLLTLLSISATHAQRTCNCRPATEDERPNRANEDIGLRFKTVDHLAGRVTDPNYEPIKKAVIEVYSCTNSECGKDWYRIENSTTRMTACVADDEGRFCFSGLTSGLYVLKIGTHDPDGFQAVYARVKLDRHWWSRWLRSSAELKIVLPVGT